MRLPIPHISLGLALITGATTGHAQTVITGQFVDRPVAAVVAQQSLVTVPAGTVVQPIQTVRTIETVRTIQLAPRRAGRQIVTARTITRQRLVPAPTVLVRTVTTSPRPLYDEVVSAPMETSSDDGYSTQALYDTVGAAPVAPAVVAPTTTIAIPAVQDVYTTPYIYRYVYEPDRILVIDPNTGVAVQAIPR